MTIPKNLDGITVSATQIWTAGFVTNPDGSYSVTNQPAIQTLASGSPGVVSVTFENGNNKQGTVTFVEKAADGSTVASFTVQNEGGPDANTNFLVGTDGDPVFGDNFIVETGTGVPTPQIGWTYSANAFSTTPPCFAAGTRIATPGGEAAVETLQPGDLVATASGQVRPVAWVGRRGVDCARHPSPKSVWPIRVTAGAFAPGQPSRDLFLSPDHAVSAEGVLIPVRLLVNGSTVAQVERARVSYFHVELETHDLLLAEGLPVESFLDTGNRDAFANAAAMALHAAFEPRGDVTRAWEAYGCAPLKVHGPEVERAQAGLAERAGLAEPAAQAEVSRAA